MINDQMPHPEVVARAAAEEPAPRLLEDYLDAIQILRQKEFTFREIANWLKEEFGIQADHNSVWRAYTKGMDHYSAHLEAEADEVTARDEALAEAEANGTFIASSGAPVTQPEVKVVEAANAAPAKTVKNKTTPRKSKKKIAKR